MTTTMALLIGFKGMVALTAAAGVALLLRDAPASRRHLVWAGGLAALLLLPALEVAGPWWTVPVPESRVVARALAVAGAPATRSGVGEAAGPRIGGSGEAPGAGVDASGEAPGAALPSGRAGSPIRASSDDPVAPAMEASGVSASSPVQPDSRPAGTVERWASRVGGPLALAAWMLGVLALTIRLARGHRAAGRLVRASVPVPAGIAARATRVAAALGVRGAVEVRMHRAIPVPLVVGVLRPTVLLPADAPTWSEETLDHVLLHELAHVVRRDPATHLLADAARVLHWPNPMAWVAVRCLRQESERACDDRVLAQGRRASGYAADLVRVARTLGVRPAPRAAAVAMARTPDLADRVEALLDPRRPRQAAGPRAVLGAVGGALALSVALGGAVPAGVGGNGPEAGGSPAEPVVSREGEPAPRAGVRDAGAPASFGSVMAPGSAPDLPPQQDPRLCRFPDDADGRSTSIHSDGDAHDVRLRVEQGDCRFELVGRGEIVFSADDRSVASIAQGGRLDLEERSGRGERRVRILPSGGALERLWWVDGERRAWDGEADAWLGAVLPWIFQETTLNAEPRVRHMLAEGGVDRVLAEADGMRTDHVARRYIELAVEHGEVGEDQAIRIMRIAAGMDADHHKASLLKAMAEHQGLGTDRLREPFLEAATSIDADHHVRSVLELLLDQPGLTMEQRDAVLLAATRIEADHHVASILERVVREGGISEAGRRTFMTVLLSIEADHHRRSVIETFLDAERLAPAELATVLELVDRIDADHHRAAVLQRVAGGYPLEGAEIDAFRRAAVGIGSDHHLRSVAEAVARRERLSEAQVGLVLALAGSVGSDHHRQVVLETVARRHALSPSQRAEYQRLAEEMSDRRADEALAVLYRASR